MTDDDRLKFFQMRDAERRAAFLLNQKYGRVGRHPETSTSPRAGLTLTNVNVLGCHTAIQVDGSAQINFEGEGSYNGIAYGINYSPINPREDKLKINQHGTSTIEGGFAGISVPAESKSELNQFDAAVVKGGTHGVHERDADLDALQKLFPGSTPPELIADALDAVRRTNGTGEQKAEAALKSPVRAWLVEHGVDLVGLSVSIAALFV